MAGKTAHGAVTAALAEFNRALRFRDAGIVERFHKSALFVGSEPGELARGRAAITALFAKILASASTVQFDWTSVETARSGGTLWFFADGAVVIRSPGGEERRPYGLTGVLVKGKKGWRWRLFHGSEPWVAPPTP